MSNDHESSSDNDDDVVSSSFLSLEKTLEAENIIIIDNKIHDYGINNDANDEGRRINEHEKDYFMREAKYAGVTRSFKHLLIFP